MPIYNTFKNTWLTYGMLAIILLLAVILTIMLRHAGWIQGIPVIAACLTLLVALFRDESKFRKHLYLQQQNQVFDLGVMSHMAELAFDRHVEFCEKYIRTLDEGLLALATHGPYSQPTAGSHKTYAGDLAYKLYKIRRDYIVWLSKDINTVLEGLEKPLHTVDISNILLKTDKPGYLGSNSGRRGKLVDQMMAAYSQILGLHDPEKPSPTEDEKKRSGEEVIQYLRSILSIDKLTVLREFALSKASSQD